MNKDSDFYQKSAEAENNNSVDKTTEKESDLRNFISPLRQMFYFLFGWGGLTILSIIVSQIVIFFAVKENWLSFVDDKPLWASEYYELLANTIVISVGYGLLALGFFFLVGLKVYKKIIAQFKSANTIVRGLGFGFLTLFAAAIIGTIVQLIYGQPLPDNNNEDGVNSFITAYPLIGFLVVVIIGPIVEELTYRLGLFALVKRKNRILAYAVTIVVFALIHFDYQAENLEVELFNLPIYLGMAAVLTYSYDDKDSIGTSIIAHMVNNGFSFALTFIIPYLS